MLYIYDILVNFMDGNRIYDFYEWNNDDIVEHIKKIPVIKVSDDFFFDLVYKDVRVSKDFLSLIKNKTCTYKETIEYSCIFSNTSRCYAFEFNEVGDILFKSSLLIDEEDEINESSKKLPEFMFKYDILDGNVEYRSLTRREERDINLIRKEIVSTYNSKNYDKFSYLYNEVYGGDDLSIEDGYKRLINDLDNDCLNNFKKLVYLINLVHKKKKTI